MASNGVSTAGSKFGYAAYAGTAPTTFTKVPEVKSVPALNPEPSTLETTSLEATDFKTYTNGLKDLGGALAFTCNLTTELKTVWADVMDKSAAATSSAGAIWFCINHPTMGAVRFMGQPSDMGMPEMGVDSVLEVDVYVTPTSAPIWADTTVTINDYVAPTQGNS